MIRRCLGLAIASGVVLGCAVNRPTVLSTPLKADDIQLLENASKERPGTVSSDGEVVAAGKDFVFSETEVFLENERQVREVFPLNPSISLAFRSTARGAKLGFARGFWILAGISGLLFIKTGGGEDDGEWLLPFMAASGVVGGAVGSLFGAANGGTIRFEFLDARGVTTKEGRVGVGWKTECCR